MIRSSMLKKYISAILIAMLFGQVILGNITAFAQGIDASVQGGVSAEDIDQSVLEELEREQQEKLEEEMNAAFGDENDDINSISLIEISPDDDQFDLIRKRLRTETVNLDPKVDEYIASMKEDGSWPNKEIVYTNIDVAAPHLTRLMRMAREFDEPTSKWYRSEELADKINKGLLFWYNSKLEASNQWWKLIGAPQTFVRILTLMYGFIDFSTIEKMCELIYDMDEAGWYSQGTNLTWICTWCIYKGTLLKEPEIIREACQYIWNEVTYEKIEGPQVDGSFFQHGTQIYNNGYGKSFLLDTAKWIERFQGTEFVAPEYVIDILTTIVLDGNRWMRRGPWLDLPGTNGRAFLRYDDMYDTGLAQVAQLLADNGSDRAEELRELADAVINNKPTAFGNRCFWYGDYMAHHRDDYYVTVRTNSKRTVRTEQHSQENPYGHWVGLGYTSVYKTGDDYQNIYQYYDFARLPGETIPHRKVLVDFNGATGRNLFHRANFVGGVSDGIYGAECMRLDDSGTKGNKAWFFFDDEFVSLGSGIVSTAKDQINTTIDQRYLLSDVEVDGQTIKKGVKEYKNINNVFHDDIGYVFPGGTNINIKNTSVTESYRNLGTYYADYEKKTADMFLMWFNHGNQPSNGSYSYITVPSVTKDEFEEYNKDIAVEIVENSKKAQCVYHNKLKIAQMFVYTPKTIKVSDELSVNIKQAGGYMIKINDKAIELTVSDPCKISKNFDVEIIYKNKVYTVNIELPQQKFAGQSVSTSISFE